jgi:Na+/proline symporter
MGKMNVITTGITDKGFDWNDRFNIFSGVIGGFFLALSYFGTDQSQVGRYLTASSIKESRIGLIMNGIVKIPMQYFILLIGVLVFVYYTFNTSPVFFNQLAVDKLKATAYKSEVEKIEADHALLTEKKKVLQSQWGNGSEQLLKNELKNISDQEQANRKKMSALVKSSGIAIEPSDTNYIFIRFVTDHLPKGLVGLLIAVIFLAAWGSIAATLNSLSSSTLIDFHKIHINKNLSAAEEFSLSKLYTLFWGMFCIIFAQFATNLGSLIEAVNILGSWFYGVMLGVFLVAFYLKRIGGNAVFYAAIVGEALVLLMYGFTSIGWLWLNAIGALAVPLAAIVFQSLFKKEINNQ